MEPESRETKHAIRNNEYEGQTITLLRPGNQLFWLPYRMNSHQGFPSTHTVKKIRASIHILSLLAVTTRKPPTPRKGIAAHNTFSRPGGKNLQKENMEQRREYPTSCGAGYEVEWCCISDEDM